MVAETQKAFLEQEHVKKRVPAQATPFSVGDIRSAIPPHCFKHSLLRSFGYLFRDLAIVVVVALAALYLDSKITALALGPFVSYVLKSALWLCYWAINGSVMTGLWVIGHECGHGGFAASATINNVVGFLVHSALLVPFFSWQISHRRHHSNTGNVDKDEVFVPEVRENFKEDHLESDNLTALKNSFIRLLQIVIMMTLGWPLYLAINATGHKTYPKGAWVNHFIPTSPIFAEKEKSLVLLSDLGVVGAFFILYRLSSVYSFLWVLKLYILPLLVVNFFLVLITFLQHTDFALPHYTSSEWDWLRGALATIDRDFGILNGVFHHITDTHVVHHLFSKMPFYHAQEATEAVKPLLKDYYRYDNTHWLYALWVNFQCIYAQPDPFAVKSGILWFHPPVVRRKLLKE